MKKRLYGVLIIRDRDHLPRHITVNDEVAIYHTKEEKDKARGKLSATLDKNDQLVNFEFTVNAQDILEAVQSV